MRRIDEVGDDYREDDKIVDKERGEHLDDGCQAWAATPAPRDPDAYIDSMIEAGWTLSLAVRKDGSATLFEQYPARPGCAALEEGYRISAWWMATLERRSEVKLALRRRGLVRYL